MKKLFALMTLFLFAFTCFAQVDTVATSPGGFAGLYERWGDLMWTILAALGVTGWLGYRLSKALALMKTVSDAFQDGKISGQEGRDIEAAVKALVGKRPK